VSCSEAPRVRDDRNAVSHFLTDWHSLEPRARQRWRAVSTRRFIDCSQARSKISCAHNVGLSALIDVQQNRDERCVRRRARYIQLQFDGACHVEIGSERHGIPLKMGRRIGFARAAVPAKFIAVGSPLRRGPTSAENPRTAATAARL